MNNIKSEEEKAGTYFHINTVVCSLKTFEIFTNICGEDSEHQCPHTWHQQIGGLENKRKYN
jgi:hypothetical protein